MNISEALSWKKVLEKRHAELSALRNQNANRRVVRYGGQQPEEREEPLYNPKALDKRVTLIAREIRIVDEAIKRTNANVQVAGLERDENVLGELE